MKAYNQSEFVTTATDGQFSLWRYDQAASVCQVKLVNEQVNGIEVHGKSILTSSSANRISMHTPNRYEVRTCNHFGLVFALLKCCFSCVNCVSSMGIALGSQLRGHRV